jgi:hypothetical protein
MATPRLIPEARPLTGRERLLLAELLRHGTRHADAFAGQVPRVSVVSRCSCGCPTLDLAVDGRTASPGSPSTILAGAAGVSPEGVPFEIILHGREGMLSELEVYAPAGADGPFTLPGVEGIEFFGEPRTETPEL